MERTIISMPSKPPKNDNLGVLLSPVLTDYLGDVFKAKKILTVNLLHSYQDSEKYLESYLDKMVKLGINFDSIHYDNILVNSVMEVINEMLEVGVIKTAREEFYRCECGRVEMVTHGLKLDGGSIYNINNGSPYCNFCGCECNKYAEDILYIPLDKDKMTEVSVSPLFLKKRVNGYDKKFAGNKWIISKARNTGYSIIYNNHEYYIDIDFLWMNMFRFIEDDEKLLITSNHQSFKIFLINYLYSIYKPEKLSFLMHPYLKGDTNNFINNDMNSLIKKMSILYNLSWSHEECTWDNGTLKFLSKLSNQEQIFLYNNMINCIDNKYKNFDEEVNHVLKKGTNLDRSVLKRCK